MFCFLYCYYVRNLLKKFADLSPCTLCNLPSFFPQSAVTQSIVLKNTKSVNLTWTAPMYGFEDVAFWYDTDWNIDSTYSHTLWCKFCLSHAPSYQSRPLDSQCCDYAHHPFMMNNCMQQSAHNLCVFDVCTLCPWCLWSSCDVLAQWSQNSMMQILMYPGCFDIVNGIFIRFAISINNFAGHAY